MFTFNRFIDLLRRTLLAGLLASLIFASSAVNPVLAMHNVFYSTETPATESEHLIAVVSCLPKELSQPSLKRAWDEMGDDQLQRVFHLNDSPKLSQAEIELASCLNRGVS